METVLVVFVVLCLLGGGGWDTLVSAASVIGSTLGSLLEPSFTFPEPSQIHLKFSS
jgi:hypothetical protein